MTPDRMGTDPETVDRAKRTIEVLRDAGIEPDGVEFRHRSPDGFSGRNFALHFDDDNDAFTDQNRAGASDMGEE